jgi:hypothetical protein
MVWVVVKTTGMTSGKVVVQTELIKMNKLSVKPFFSIFSIILLIGTLSMIFIFRDSKLNINLAIIWIVVVLIDMILLIIGKIAHENSCVWGIAVIIWFLAVFSTISTS